MAEALTRQTVRLGYLLLLGREPEDETVIDRQLQVSGVATIQDFRARLIASEEFVGSLGHAMPPRPPATGAAAVIEPLDGMLANAPEGRDNFFTDRFGVRTRVGYLPPEYAKFSGQVGSADGSFDMPVHEPEELNALLRSVAQAKDQFTAMELGAGWGPWIVLGAKLAERRGLPAMLTGVEGSSEHVEFMRSHLRDNGLDPADHRVIHAVVGGTDGVAHFPRLPDPSGDWGAAADYARDPARADMEEVRCVSLQTLLGSAPVLDYLHCDVQGAEADVFGAAMAAVNMRVRRTCIGTHSRAIEATLFDLLATAGWILEFEQPSRFIQVETRMVLVGDGVQVWRNPRLA